MNVNLTLKFGATYDERLDDPDDPYYQELQTECEATVSR